MATLSPVSPDPEQQKPDSTLSVADTSTAPAVTVPAMSHDRETVLNIFKYTALLFIFPAAALVNYAWIPIDNLPYFDAGILLFILFIFLVIEGTSSSLWLNMRISKFQFSDLAKLRNEKRKAFRIGTTDILRVFFLFVFYISLLKYAASETEGLHRLTITSFGLFLLANFFWNLQVESASEAQAAIKEYMDSIRVDDEQGNVDHGGEIYRWLVKYIYRLQLLLFVVFFPGLSMYLIVVTSIELVLTWQGWNTTHVSSWLYFVSFRWIIAALVIQIVAKMLQAWVLSHVYDASTKRKLRMTG
jgi:hypothetical protein